MWTLLKEISLRHLRHSPLRTALVVFGIALGVCMLSAMLATNETLGSAFADMVERVAGKADLTVAGTEAGISSTLTGEIADLEGVEHAAAMLEVVTRSPKPGGTTMLVLGVDLLGDTFFLPFAQEGEHQVVKDPLAFVNDPTAILVSTKLAETQGLKQGDELPLITAEGTKVFKVRGLLEAEGPAASYGGQVAVMFLDAAQVSFARGYAVDRIDVVAKEGQDVGALKQRIETLLDGRAKVEEPKGRTRRLVASLDAFRNGLNLMGLIALGVGTFLIYNAVSVSVAQRRREVGVLRALGATRGAAVRMFCLEGLVMAVLGVALGLPLAQYLAQVALTSVTQTVARLIVPIQPAPPHVTLPIALAGATAGIVATLFASYLPARATNKIDPAEALRSSRASSNASFGRPWIMTSAAVFFIVASPLLAGPGTEESGYLSSLSIMVGFALLAPLGVRGLRRLFVGVAEAGLGIPGRLALDNVERSLGRSSSIVIALMLAIAMSMTVGAYAVSFEASIMQWVDDAFSADAAVTAGSPTVDRNHVAFAPSLADKARAVPGVKAVNTLRNVSIVVAGKNAQISAIDTKLQFAEAEQRGRKRKVLDGPQTFAVDALVAKPRLLISGNLAHFTKLGAGDTLQLDTPSGPKPFEIYAVVVDYSSDQGWLMLDRKWYDEYWDDEPLDLLEVYFQAGADPEKTADALRAKLGESGGMIFVSSHDALREELRGVARALFAYAQAPELITLIVAIMGVIGTMLAAVIDRIREIGMLRAIGATQKQVVTSLVVESAFLGFTAAVCGIVAGVPQGFVFMRVIGMSSNGWHLPYTFPLETALRVSSIVIVAAAVSGLLPGRRAAGMDVKEALAYE
ncbi:MAG TPA: FtsX-like permease family protein [Polyangiales bacterium]|nr:FtsX-like permease family protein [Polyangiales bacterium]